MPLLVPLLMIPGEASCWSGLAPLVL